VYPAGGRFNHHGFFVAEGVGYRVELAGVGCEGGGPPTAGVVAGAGLYAGFEVAEGGVLAVAEVAGGA